jgi:uncharacterized protein
VRRHRHLIVEQAARHGAETARVLGAVASGEEAPGDDLELLVESAPKGTVVNLLILAAELEDLVGVPVKIRTADQLSKRQQAGVTL